MQDELDIRRVTSNDIRAVLNTYGVEAARAAIITEIFTVYNRHGVSVDTRHLTFIADYMTHNGGYRPISRIGGIADSISTFSKMSFETASMFLVEPASHARVDNSETPNIQGTDRISNFQYMLVVCEPSQSVPQLANNSHSHRAKQHIRDHALCLGPLGF
ncbi:hypothetical protein Cgig2_013646 [Carnegiea gigantea]|uniref:DNA-directed RNA polymerase n=1 Tax=Carnegiea gigantea TaxID=171969 RepID=A0A9Q1QFQ9_9CARY|nr:hypothetical protein Cgig2_013646 [Carnegiea gigantea]